MAIVRWQSLRQWVAAGLVVASVAGAVSPFTLRFGASGALSIPMTYDPADPDGELLMFQLGFRAGAADGLDVYDVPTITRTMESGVPVLCFPTPDPVVGALSQDYRAPSASAVWELSLDGLTAGATVRLQWALVADGGSLDGNTLSLVDRTTGAVLAWDMTTTGSAEFTGTDRSLLILYGAANHPPVARGDTAAMLRADGTIAIPVAQLLANDYDNDAGDSLTVVGVGAPGLSPGVAKGASAYGTTALVDAAVTYALPAELPSDWNGTVCFTYTVRDSNLTDPRETSAVVVLKVAPSVLAVPTPASLAVHPGSPLAATYLLSYTAPLDSLRLEFALPYADSGEGPAFWTFGGAASYGDDDAATAAPTITDTGAGLVTLDFGTAVPASGTRFWFAITMPANGADAALPALARYRVTGAETEPLQQAMPELIIRAAYLATFVAAVNGTLTGTTAQLLEPGMLSTLVTAVPAAGHHFVRWLRDGVEVSRSNPLAIVGGAADTAVTAEFGTDLLTVTFAVSGSGWLVGENPQIVPYGGSTSPVTAEPAAGYTFIRWSDDRTDNPRTDTTVSTDLDLTAVFADITGPAAPIVAGTSAVHTATPTWTWASGGDGGNGTFRYQLDGTAGSWAETTALSFTPVTGLPDGTHTLYVQERDAAGNWSAAGSFATAVDAVCTVTYAVEGEGTLAGSLEQTVLYGGGTTAVTATAADGYVFWSWNDGRTDSPRIDVNVTADARFTARFLEVVSPIGGFQAAVDASAAADGRGWWDLTGHYATTVAGLPLDLDLVHDTRGRLTGTGTVAKAATVRLLVRGSVRGSAGNVLATIALQGTNADMRVRLTMVLALNAASGTLVGPATGSLAGADARSAVDEVVTLTLPAGMDGSWALGFSLSQAAGRIRGTALLTLSNHAEYGFELTGRALGEVVVLSLVGNPADPAARSLRIVTTVTPLAGDMTMLQAFSGEGYGQSLEW